MWQWQLASLLSSHSNMEHGWWGTAEGGLSQTLEDLGSAIAMLVTLANCFSSLGLSISISILKGLAQITGSQTQLSLEL